MGFRVEALNNMGGTFYSGFAATGGGWSATAAVVAALILVLAVFLVSSWGYKKPWLTTLIAAVVFAVAVYALHKCLGLDQTPTTAVGALAIFLLAACSNSFKPWFTAAIVAKPWLTTLIVAAVFAVAVYALHKCLGLDQTTTTVVGALAIFLLKVLWDRLVELQRQQHLLSALAAYVECAKEDLDATANKADFLQLRRKIERNKDFTPYSLFDANEGLSMRDILLNYGFIDDNTMRKVVRYMAAESYLHSLHKELRTEYARALSQQRKIKFLGALERALTDARERSAEAHEALASR